MYHTWLGLGLGYVPLLYNNNGMVGMQKFVDQTRGPIARAGTSEFRQTRLLPNRQGLNTVTENLGYSFLVATVSVGLTAHATHAL